MNATFNHRITLINPFWFISSHPMALIHWGIPALSSLSEGVQMLDH